MFVVLLLLVLPLLPLLMILFLGGGFLATSMNKTADGGNFTPSTEQEKVAVAIKDYVLSQNGTLEFACAWIGNAEGESGLKADCIQGGFAYNNSWATDENVNGYALGLFQMDGGRRVAMLKKATEEKKNWQDIEFQLKWVWNFDKPDNELLKKYATRKDMTETTLDLLKNWERAGTQNNREEQNKRTSSAQKWFALFSSGKSGASGGQIKFLQEKVGSFVYNGQCYGLTAFYVDSFNTPIHLGSGSPHGLTETTGSDTVSAWNIGKAYLWEKHGWQVIHNPKFSEVKKGDIINWGMGGYAKTEYGHTGIVADVGKNNRFFTYEQNAEGKMVNYYARTWGVEFPNVTSLVRKK